MSVDIAEVLEGLAERLRTIPSLPTVYAFMPEAIVTPCAVLGLGEDNSYDDDFDGAMTLEVKIQCLVNRGGGEGAQRQLYAWAAHSGTDSVRGAISADPDLGGVADSVEVSSFSGPASYDYGDGVVGIEFTCEVIG
jgi:hypothetical protein